MSIYQTWAVPWTTSSTTTTSTILYNGNGWWNQTSPVVTYKADFSRPPVVEAAAKPESDMDWLRRRIAEVSWAPA